LDLIGEAYINSGCHPYGFGTGVAKFLFTGVTRGIEGFALNYFIPSAFPSSNKD